jgi:hypothetical protein
MYSYMIYKCNKKLAQRYTVIHITREAYGGIRPKKFPDVATDHQVVARGGASAWQH